MNRITNYSAKCWVNENKGTPKPAKYFPIGTATGSYTGEADPVRMMFVQNPQMLPADRVRIRTWES